MKIARVILRVSDLDEATRFWSEVVGLAVVFSGGPFAFLDAGGVQLVLNQVDEVTGQDSQTELVIEVDDFATEHSAMVSRGVPFEVDPRPVTSDHERDLLATHFRDADGNLASLTGWVIRQA